MEFLSDSFWLLTQINKQVERDRLMPRIANQIDVVEEARLNALGRIQFLIVINNASLVVFLTLITWESLFFLLRPLAKATQAREDFLIQATHELRTPLAILYSELSLSENENNIDELKKTHKDALQEIQRLQQLSNTLLGRKEEKLQTVKVEKVIQQAWSNLSKFNVNNLTLNFNFKGKTIIKSDTVKFYQLIFNILENAVKHGKANSKLNIQLEQNQIIFSNQSEFNIFVEGVGASVSKSLAEDLGMDINFEMNNYVYKAKLNLA